MPRILQIPELEENNGITSVSSTISSGIYEHPDRNHLHSEFYEKLIQPLDPNHFLKTPEKPTVTDTPYYYVDSKHGELVPLEYVSPPADSDVMFKPYHHLNTADRPPEYVNQLPQMGSKDVPQFYSPPALREQTIYQTPYYFWNRDGVHSPEKVYLEYVEEVPVNVFRDPKISKVQREQQEEAMQESVHSGHEWRDSSRDQHREQTVDAQPNSLPNEAVFQTDTVATRDTTMEEILPDNEEEEDGITVENHEEVMEKKTEKSEGNINRKLFRLLAVGGVLLIVVLVAEIVFLLKYLVSGTL